MGGKKDEHKDKNRIVPCDPTSLIEELKI